MIADLLNILKGKHLQFTVLETTASAFIIEFDVLAKPGARVEKVFVSKEGCLVVQTRSKPVEGEANQAIIETISDLTGTPKSNVEIVRGDKSRNKRIKLLVSFTANKKAPFYQTKFSEIEVQQA
ncbi:MAG: DUF167 domain-containing protein [Bacteriovorax sp.]